MGKKETPKTEGEFQLNPDDFKTGNFLLDKPAAAAIKAINELDLNKDGKRDLGQVVALGVKILPLLGVLNEVVDFEELAEAVAESDFVKDKEKFKETIVKLGSLAEQMGTLIPPKV